MASAICDHAGLRSSLAGQKSESASRLTRTTRPNRLHSSSGGAMSASAAGISPTASDLAATGPGWKTAQLWNGSKSNERQHDMTNTIQTSGALGRDAELKYT